MDKFRRAKNLLIELESLREPNLSVSNMQYLYEIALRDAEALAKEIAKEEESQAA
jgi:hypothetical protein